MKTKDKLKLLAELNKTYRFNSLNLSAINTKISHYDDMLDEKTGGERHYFNVGFSALQNILKAIFLAQKAEKEIKNILDFPSGYGRELRFLKVYFSKSDIIAGEIDKRALKFCNETFKVNTLLSNKDFRKIDIKQKFDLIWCGSLFTHINKNRFKHLLEFFIKSLKHKGVLVFTSHGKYSYQEVKNKKRNYGMGDLRLKIVLLKYKLFGYGYFNYWGRRDYGISIIKPSWIMKTLEKNNKLKIILYKEKSWDNHQDVIACVKEEI